MIHDLLSLPGVEMNLEDIHIFIIDYVPWLVNFDYSKYNGVIHDFR